MAAWAAEGTSLTRFEWQTLILSASGPISPTVRLVCCAVGKHLNAAGVCWPSVGRLAECSALSERAVQRALQEAEGGGWLVRETTPGRVTHYHLATPAGVSPPAVCHPPPAQVHPSPVAQSPGGDRVAPELLKEGSREPNKEGGGPPSCPLCSAYMEKKEPRNKKKGGKPFWGCVNYSSMGCKGKLELDEAPAGESTLVAAALALSAKVDRDRKARMRDPIKIGDLADLRPIQIPDRLKPDTRTA